MGGQADGALFLTGGRFGTAEDFTMNYRLCTKDDIPLMCRMRKRQLAREGIDTRIDLDEDMYRFFSDKMADGSLVEWFLEEPPPIKPGRGGSAVRSHRQRIRARRLQFT